MGAYYDYVAARTPKSFWKLGSATGNVDLGTVGENLTYGGAVLLDQLSIIPSETSTSVLLDGTSGSAIDRTLSGLIATYFSGGSATGGFSLEFTFKPTERTATTNEQFLFSDGIISSGIDPSGFTLSDTPSLVSPFRAAKISTDYFQTSVWTGTGVGAYDTKLITLTCSNKSWLLYINGTLLTTIVLSTAALLGGAPSVSRFFYNAFGAHDPSNVGMGAIGNAQAISFYNSTLTPTDISDGAAAWGISNVPSPVPQVAAIGNPSARINGSQINGVTIGGGVGTPSVLLLPPVGQWFSAECTAKTDFTTFLAFITGSTGTHIDFSMPPLTDIRVAFRFVSGGNIVNHRLGNAFGNFWEVYNGDPLTLPQPAEVQTWNASVWLEALGFIPATDYFQYIFYMKTDSANVVPSVTLARIAYQHPPGAEIVEAINIPTAIPVPSTTDLEAGLWVFDTSQGYRLESNSLDYNSAAIQGSITTQAIMLAASETDYKEAQVEIESTVSGTVTVTLIIDKEEQTSKTIAITAGTRRYEVGVISSAQGMYIQGRIEWTSPSMVIKSFRVIGDPQDDDIA